MAVGATVHPTSPEPPARRWKGRPPAGSPPMRVPVGRRTVMLSALVVRAVGRPSTASHRRPEDIVANVEGTDGSTSRFGARIFRMDLVPEKPTDGESVCRHWSSGRCISSTRRRSASRPQRSPNATSTARRRARSRPRSEARAIQGRWPASIPGEARSALRPECRARSPWRDAHEDAERRALEGELHG